MVKLLDTTVTVAPFRLTDTFIDQYRRKNPKFGFNGLGELAYVRTYSRLKEDGTNEKWFETIRRVVEGTYTTQKRWILANGLPWSENKAHRSAHEMYERMFEMKFLPPGRGMWAMGSPLTEERGLYAALNNCAFVSTATIADDVAEPFTFLMDASMLGIGVGFDTKGAGRIGVGRCDGVVPEVMVIPDTREGWVDSVGRLIASYLEPERGERLEFDYSLIRPEGEPIKGFGGVAAGPEPLRKLHVGIRRVLDANAGAPLSVTAIVDLMNLIGQCVVAGNVRRSAEIAFGASDSEEFLDLKNRDVNPERNHPDTGWAWASNNSVFADVGMDYGPAAERVAANGEPGFAWLDNMRRFSRMGDPADNKDARVAGGNPCLEQSLESYELCCLVETFPARHESLEDFQRTLKFAYLYAKTVTLGKTPWPKTNRVMTRNRRIGCSQSGIVQAIARLGIEEYRTWCEAGYATVCRYDRVYSEWLGVPESIKKTSVKPSGTISLPAGALPGMHHPESLWYIRRVRLGVHSELIEPLRKAGYHVEPCIGQEATTVVAEIPVAINERGIRPVSDVSMWEQLALAAFLQRHWADNQVSCTVTFDPAAEGPHIKHALRYYQYQLKGISFLPRLDEGAYPQMPYEAITAERYAELMAGIKPLKIGTSHVEAEQERFCDSSSCVIA